MCSTLQLPYKIGGLRDRLSIQADSILTISGLKATIHHRHNEYFDDVGPHVLDIWWIWSDNIIQIAHCVDMAIFDQTRPLAELFPAGLFPADATHGYILVDIPVWIRLWI
jgi:hypothetical protein